MGSLFFRFQLSAFILFVTACSSVPSRPSGLASSVAATRVAISRATETASHLKGATPAESAAISDLREQLATVGASFDVTTAKVQWYETDWARLDGENKGLKKTISDRDVTIATQAKALHQTAKERDFYPLLFALGCAALAGIAFGPWALKLPGMLGFIGPFAIVLGGGAFGFTASRMLSAWGSRLLP